MDPALAFPCSILPLSTRTVIGSKLAFALVPTYSGTTVGTFGVTLVTLSYVGDPSLDMVLAMVLVIAADLGTGRTTHTGDALIRGLPNSLVTIGLVVRLNSGAGLVGVLTEILGIPGGVTTDSTAR